MCVVLWHQLYIHKLLENAFLMQIHSDGIMLLFCTLLSIFWMQIVLKINFFTTNID